MRTAARCFLVLAWLLAATGFAAAEVRLPRLFGDHMVLQREKPVRIWGWADKGEKVAVSFAGQEKAATAGDDGKWLVQLDPMKAAAEARDLAVKGATNTATLKDVLVGEVWLCGGQSNMETPLSGSLGGAEAVAAANLPAIRFLELPTGSRAAPQDDLPPEGKRQNGTIKTAWAVAGPETAGKFGAVAFYFAAKLHQELKVPVGIINNSWGGTIAATWTSRKALEAIPEAKPMLDSWDRQVAEWSEEKAKADHEAALKDWEQRAAAAKAKGDKKMPGKPAMKEHPSTERYYPGGGYNATVAPIERFAVRGALFYQGENENFPPRTYLYTKTYPAVIADWRRAFADPNLPFCIIQIAGWGQPETDENIEVRYLPNRDRVAHIRETHLMTHLATPNTGFVVALEISAVSMHPPNKRPVGERAAAWALATQYGRTGLDWCGPLYKSMEKKGGGIVIHFVPEGLRKLHPADGDSLTGFIIAGQDQVFFPADAQIVGKTVEVSSKFVPDPAAVRYRWGTQPAGNLCGDGLPASPFRTDEWSLGTDPPFERRGADEMKEWESMTWKRAQELKARRDLAKEKMKSAEGPAR